MSLATIRQNREIRKQLEQQLERHRNGLQEKPVADIPPSSLNPHAESGQTESSEDVEKKAGCKGENAQQAQEWQVIQGLEVGGVERRSSAQSLESIESAEPPTTEGKDRAPRPLNADDARSERTRSSSRASRARSIRTLGTRLSVSLTGINVRDRSTKEGGDRDKQVFVVGFEGDDDLMNPHNWSYVKRMKTTCLVAAVGITVGIASSIDAEALMPAAREFHVAEVAESLATGIFLIGFGVGALFAGPFSETFGRVPVYIVTLSLFGIWIMASALAPNFGAQCAFRFLAGACGSTPLTCAGGSIADMYSPKERTLTFPIFANAAFSGPVAAPIMGGFIVQYADTWRWVEWTTLLATGLTLAGLLIAMPETFAGKLLQIKAKHLREITGDDRYAAPLEIKKETFRAKVWTALSRPFIMTAREPIIVFISLYLSVIYIILFTFLDGYDYIFAMTYGLSEGITGLMFAGILVGLFVASIIVWPVWRLTKWELARGQAAGKEKLQPEARLWTSMLGGSVAIPVSLFWMGWTAYPHISIWSPIVASVFFGFGILCVFISSYQYIIDSYEVYSASALAFVTLSRYVVAGAMVVVGVPFYENLGVHYTLTILGCLSALLIPLPYIFYFYGPAIRKRSKYAATS